jgi:predicted DNA-binding protein (UPF0251 family)
MPRKRKPRKVNFIPRVTYFKPRGLKLASLEEVLLQIDELEALRLADLKGWGQDKAAEKMKISQSTFQRILTRAHQKIAEALVNGKAIKVKGGEVIMPFGREQGRGRKASGRGGRMRGPFAAGPGGNCICTNPDCRHKTTHLAGRPCYQTKCSKCGSPMIRER